jgi:hypothetical protein
MLKSRIDTSLGLNLSTKFEGKYTSDEEIRAVFLQELVTEM